MNAVDKIRLVLQSQIVVPELSIVPTRGATSKEICDEEALIGRPFCPDHVALLREWNGLAIEVIRLFGCGESAGEVGRLSALQLRGRHDLSGAIVVGSDASGFAYLQTADCQIYSLDTDGGQRKLLARGLDDFFDRVVFGPAAAEFAGDVWLTDLQFAGIVP